MNIREAVPEDNGELQELQAKCPQGTTLVASTVNTPDFFARAKAYESHKVFVACEGNRVIGSAACALRNATVAGKISRVGYVFQKSLGGGAAQPCAGRRLGFRWRSTPAGSAPLYVMNIVGLKARIYSKVKQGS